MVGDNASGKTTVLDAVQWALSGGQDLEFNAAAQLWGSKQDGRTLRGAVLRTDLEKGDQRTRRTITTAIDIVWICRSVERIGDHAKNIAEHVIFIVEGRDIRHRGKEA